jgi:flagellar biosynthetic protein FlhB
MAEGQDQAQRTEEPTPKRLEEARKKGDAPRSQEIVAASMLFVGALSVWFFGAPLASDVTRLGIAFIDHPHDFVIEGGAMAALFNTTALRLGAALGGLAALFTAAALLSNIVQARPVFTAEKISPKLSKLSPVEGAKRIFGPSGFFNFGKGIGKIAIVGAILIFALWPDRSYLQQLMTGDQAMILTTIRYTIFKLLGLTVLAMTAIALLDFGWQTRSWKKRLRMTREEVKREQKESEGDPQIKGRQRQIREARASRRMLAAVKDATVLVMNPTHYAVALKYEATEKAAPICVAKGLDSLALRLRRAAEEAGVPVVENPPLARALHASVDLDGEIPVEHYEAVAKVIGFVMARAGQNSPPVTGRERP